MPRNTHRPKHPKRAKERKRRKEGGAWATMPARATPPSDHLTRPPYSRQISPHPQPYATVPEQEASQKGGRGGCGET